MIASSPESRCREQAASETEKHFKDRGIVPTEEERLLFEQARFDQLYAEERRAISEHHALEYWNRDL